MPQSETDRTRILRVIARMTGGPAYHVALLSGRMDPARYETLLVHGRIGPGEPSLDHVADDEACCTRILDDLGPAVHPVADMRALLALVRLLRTFRPHIVHTHTAKAGALGRLATLLAGRPRAAVVHTYHGHVLERYFNPVTSFGYRMIERALGRISDRLVGVSQATVEDLVRLRVAPRERFRTVPVGLNLGRFAQTDPTARAEVRQRLGVSDGEVLLAYVGRLAPIKRIDVLLRALASVARTETSVRLVVAGDGDCRCSLKGLVATLGLEDKVNFVGNVRDVAPLVAAADIAVLASDNEGTPVSLIEAGAGARPAVATAVGGVAEVVPPSTGILVPRGDANGLARGILRLARNPALRTSMGSNARDYVMERFSESRLVRDTEALYEELLAERRS